MNNTYCTCGFFIQGGLKLICFFLTFSAVSNTPSCLKETLHCYPTLQGANGKPNTNKGARVESPQGCVYVHVWWCVACVWLKLVLLVVRPLSQALKMAVWRRVGIELLLLMIHLCVAKSPRYRGSPAQEKQKGI